MKFEKFADGIFVIEARADLADLIGYLRKTLGRAETVSVALFEDDAAFPELLVEGGGAGVVELHAAEQGHALVHG